MANKAPEKEDTIFDKLAHLDMQLKEAERLHWAAAAAYGIAPDAEESKDVLLETTRAVTKIKAEKVKLVHDIDEITKKDPKFLEEVNDTISSCDIAMLVSMEHFTKTCAATNDLRPIVYEKRKGQVSVTMEEIPADLLNKYADGITKYQYFNWCPVCGSSRIEGDVPFPDSTGRIQGTSWDCLDCAAHWRHNWLTEKIAITQHGAVGAGIAPTEK
jgi:hypothetical protein